MLMTPGDMLTADTPEPEEIYLPGFIRDLLLRGVDVVMEVNPYYEGGWYVCRVGYGPFPGGPLGSLETMQDLCDEWNREIARRRHDPENTSEEIRPAETE